MHTHPTQHQVHQHVLVCKGEGEVKLGRRLGRDGALATLQVHCPHLRAHGDLNHAAHLCSAQTQTVRANK